MANFSPITIARFWSKVEVKDPQFCWNWTASKSKFGYGKFQDQKAHRVAYALIIGDVPEGMFCLHRCDNPSCCNPNHIFIGSIADNNKDCAAKGRTLKGENHPRATLSDKQVSDIRGSGKTGADLAKMYGVSKSTISGIRNYTTRV